MTGSAECFRELRKEFADFAETLRLQVCHWTGYGNLLEKQRVTSVRAVAHGDFRVVGSLSIPVIDRSDMCWRAIRNEKLDDDTRRRWGETLLESSPWLCVVYALTPNSDSFDAAEKFHDLAHRAGTELPPAVLNAPPPVGQSGVPRRMVDRWLWLMFWHNPPDADELDYLNFEAGAWRPIFDDPFAASVDVINGCELHTDSPRFKTRTGNSPVWTGWKLWLADNPGSAIQQTEGIRFDDIEPLVKGEQGLDSGNGKDGDASEHVAENGYVAKPSDLSAYLGQSVVMNEYTPTSLEMTTKRCVALVEDYARNHVRWSRPLAKNGTPRMNRRLIHLADWATLMRKLAGTDAEGWPPVSPEELAQRAADVRQAKAKGK